MVDQIINIPLPAAEQEGSCGWELSEFLAGPENRLAEVVFHSVLTPLAEGFLPPDAFNPVVLYGPQGTGKSRLARGLFEAWKKQFGGRTSGTKSVGTKSGGTMSGGTRSGGTGVPPVIGGGKSAAGRRAIYTSAADFARHLKNAYQAESIEEFRTRYRGAPLLVIDDVHELAGRFAAQEELLHTLDAQVAAGHRVVVTAEADGPLPTEAAGFRDFLPALRSRLMAGLTVPLVPPALEVRMELLRRLLGLRGVQVTPAALQILAEALRGTVAELAAAAADLEGCLPGGSGPSIGGMPIDARWARRYLKLRGRTQLSQVRAIAAATARYFSLKLSELRSASRRQAVVRARGVAMYLARQLTQGSLQQIGQYFGGRDHSTVLHGCRKTEDLLANEPAVHKAVLHLHQQWQKGGVQKVTVACR